MMRTVLIGLALAPAANGARLFEHSRPTPRGAPIRSSGQAITMFALAPHAAHQPGPADRDGYVTTSDGARLYYQIVGDGPRTVIIPGRLFLVHALTRLAPDRRLVFYDTRSRGRSDAVRDSAREGIDDDVRDLEAIRQHVGADKVALVGYSYMGLLVMLYAKDHPDHVERVVQLGPIPMRYGVTYPSGLSQDYATALDPKGLKELDSLEKAGYLRTHPEDYCKREWRVTRFTLVGDPAHVDRLAIGPDGLCEFPTEWPVNLNPHFEASFASIQRVNLTPADLARLSMPVLTIHGTLDRNAPYGGGREWAMKLPNARLLTVPGAAHQSFDEFPDIVVPAIDRFLTGQWPAGVEKVTALIPVEHAK